MKLLQKLLWASIPLATLAACGGSDTEDRLDVADPKVRFVHAAATAPAVSLFRADVAQADATKVSYRFASNYFDVSTSAADWIVKTATGSVTVGSVPIDAARGNKYTVVALDTAPAATGIFLIADPYNKPLGSNSTRLRLMNGAYNAGSLDVYVNAPGTDIAPAGVTPLIAATAINRAGPASGSDSVDVPGGTYQLTLTAAGTKTPLFRGQLSFANNQDLLVLALPATSAPGAVKALVKLEGTPGTTELTPL